MTIDDEVSMLVLLYEFPAETRLTVYRRLDIAKRARPGPRTTVLLTMIMMFWIRKPSTSGLGSDMIVLDNALKIWIELIK